MRFDVISWLKRNSPSRETMERHAFLRPFAHLFAHPSLWGFNRRSVSLAVAIGAFAAFIIPVAQIPLAVLIAFFLRANLAVAALTTFISNPLTMPVIAVSAYATGQRLFASFSNSASHLIDGRSWLDQGVEVLAFTFGGLVLFAVVSGIIGYFGTRFLWRWHARHRWQARGDRAKTDKAKDVIEEVH